MVNEEKTKEIEYLIKEVFMMFNDPKGAYNKQIPEKFVLDGLFIKYPTATVENEEQLMNWVENIDRSIAHIHTVDSIDIREISENEYEATVYVKYYEAEELTDKNAKKIHYEMKITDTADGMKMRGYEAIFMK